MDKLCCRYGLGRGDIRTSRVSRLRPQLASARKFTGPWQMPSRTFTASGKSCTRLPMYRISQSHKSARYAAAEEKGTNFGHG